MARPTFWKNVLRALGATVLTGDPTLRGASGRSHAFVAVGVHRESGWTLAVLEDTDERLAALVHHDVSAASTTPVLLVRPVGVDFRALMERLGANAARWDVQALRDVWREHIGRNAGGFPVTPRERLAEVLRRVGELRVQPRDGAAEVVVPEDAPDRRKTEGIWEFPLYLLTDAQVDLIARTGDDPLSLRILARVGIHSPLPHARDAFPGLLLNRHRAVAPA
jgi:hypothetical protein